MLASLLLLFASLTGIELSAAGPKAARTVVVREETVIRIPIRPVPRASMAPTMQWKAGRGPRCVTRAAIAGAVMSAPKAIDFILSDGRRMRAELEKSCPALDYYRGFYLRPTSDGAICADRDPIHARSGGECGIERFLSLTAKPKR